MRAFESLASDSWTSEGAGVQRQDLAAFDDVLQYLEQLGPDEPKRDQMVAELMNCERQRPEELSCEQLTLEWLHADSSKWEQRLDHVAGHLLHEALYQVLAQALSLEFPDASASEL